MIRDQFSVLIDCSGRGETSPSLKPQGEKNTDRLKVYLGQEEEDNIVGRNLGRSLWKVSLGFILYLQDIKL